MSETLLLLVEAPPSPAPAASLAAPWHTNITEVGGCPLLWDIGALQGFSLNWHHQAKKLKTLFKDALFA